MKSPETGSAAGGLHRPYPPSPRPCPSQDLTHRELRRVRRCLTGQEAIAQRQAAVMQRDLLRKGVHFFPDDGRAAVHRGVIAQEP